MAVDEGGTITRGFLFADLRGYTDFVERHGAAAAAALLTRYRALAREAIARFGGAEIKTEGDSFYVVFSSVSSAVRCGLAIISDARVASDEHPAEPIRVGVGVHAGETIEAEGGYVGSSVNIAARICAQAGPGEVLVSETVRALTMSLLPVRFRSRGRRQLKGIGEPIELFAVVEAPEGATAWPSAGRRRAPRRARCGARRRSGGCDRRGSRYRLVGAPPHERPPVGVLDRWRARAVERPGWIPGHGSPQRGAARCRPSERGRRLRRGPGSGR